MSQSSVDYGDADVMTLTQAAKFLRVTPTDLMNAVRMGHLPTHRIGRRLWFSRAELLQALSAARRYDGGNGDAVAGR